MKWKLWDQSQRAKNDFKKADHLSTISEKDKSLAYIFSLTCIQCQQYWLRFVIFEEMRSPETEDKLKCKENIVDIKKNEKPSLLNN